MPTGCCSGGGNCSCKIAVPDNSRVTISGSGQPSDPFVIDAELVVVGVDSQSFDVVVSGEGSSVDPMTVSVDYLSTAKLDYLPDVNAPAPTNGQVLAWSSATGRWIAAAPTTAAAGAVQHDTTLAGDGSVGSPLGAVPITARLLGAFPTGLGLTDVGLASVVQHFVDAAARTAQYPAPRLNSLSMLDTGSGVVEYWNGTAWRPLPNQTQWSNVGQYLALSGPWSTDLPTWVMVRQIAATTDVSGRFDVLSPTDLAGRAGVLAVTVQESGTGAPWKAMTLPDTTKITGIAYRLSDGAPLAGASIAATVIAILY